MKREQAQAKKAIKARKRNLAEDRTKRPPLPPPTTEGFMEIASRSTKVRELQLLWRNARDMKLLTDELRTYLGVRAKELGA
jgi:hypothetical protein